MSEQSQKKEAKKLDADEAVQADSIIVNKQETITTKTTSTSNKSTTDWPLINLIATGIVLVLDLCFSLCMGVFGICALIFPIITLITSSVLYFKTKDSKAMIAIILSVVGIVMTLCFICIGAALFGGMVAAPSSPRYYYTY